MSLNSERLYPWCEKNWENLWQQQQAGRLPHALLLVGQAGLGKQAFAEHLTQRLLCQGEANDTGACGQCRQCKLYLAGNHPDHLAIAPEEPGKAIPVDTIRSIAKFSAQTAQQQGNKVISIANAENMNIAASNALLKTLEEPTPNTFLLLVTDRPAQLLPTLHSRCQRIVFHVPPEAHVQDWLRAQVDLNEDELAAALALAGGAPRLAKAYAEEGVLSAYQDFLTQWQHLSSGQASPYHLAAQWSKQAQCLQWMQRIIATLLKRIACQQDLASYGIVTQPLSVQTHQALYHYLDKLNVLTQKQARHHLNLTLLLESLLVTWCQEVLAK